jgi:hypothetical protein
MTGLDWGESAVVLQGPDGPMQMSCPVCIGIAHGSTVFRRPLQVRERQP